MGTISRAGRAPRAPASPLSQRAPGGWKAGSRGESLAARAVLGLAGILVTWQKRLRDRDTLRAMTPAQLLDIGITREDALREAEKPFWHR